MKEYSYIVKKDGGTYTGSQMSNSAEEVKKNLEKQGFKDILINDVDSIKLQIPETLLDNKKDSNLVAGLDNPATRLSSTIEGLGRDVQSVGEAARLAKNLGTSNQKSTDIGTNTIRKEEVVFGDKTILQSLNEKLKNGCSIKFPPVMRLDSQGKMQYLFVLELS